MAPLEFNNCDATDEQKLRYAWRRPATKLETPLPDGTPAKPSAPAGKHITKVDLRGQCPPVYNQGKLGSCSANAIGFAYEFDEAPPEGEEKFIPSRLFIYYNERDMEGAIPEDTGAQLIDGIKSVLNTGVCRESIWPYAEDKFDDKPPIWATKPPTECYEEAMKNRALEAHPLKQTAEDLKGCLVKGLPFVFGFAVFESFETDEVSASGVLPMPAGWDPTDTETYGISEKCMGGHAVACVGFDDDKQAFLVRNSWGADWGVGGYFWFPYEYMLSEVLCDEFFM
jgi:C1A family cysteine protease